jgi:hypothetical protein
MTKTRALPARLSQGIQEGRPMKKAIARGLLIVTALLFVNPLTVRAECVKNARGRTVCSNDEKAGGYNARTGTAWKSEKNRGGEAKTKNGKGVYTSPSGKTCVKTANNQGCN